MECSGSQVLTGLKADGEGLHMSCSVVAGVGACVPAFSLQLDTEIKGIGVLDDLDATCRGNDLLKSLTFEHSDGGGWARWQLTCCKAGGVPTVTEPVGTETSLFKDYEGIYCPAGVDESGRPKYERQNAPTGSKDKKKKLEFNPLTGEWCVDAMCTA